MLVKGDQAARFSEKPAPDFWAALIFGEDEGVGADAARGLISAWTPKGANTEVITLDEDTVRKDSALLQDHLEAVSLLGEDRIIRLRTSGDKLAKLLTAVIREGDETAGRFAAKLIIQTGSLKKASKLRSAAEKAKNTAALQMFADEVRDVSALVADALKEAGTQIDPDALAAFSANLPGHRGIARTEIEKLSLYAHGLGRAITMADIRSLSATDVDHALSDAVYATLEGRVAAAHTALDKLAMANTSGISILRALEREAIRMLDAHAAMAAGGGHPGMKLRPPVFQNQWPAFRARLSKWPTRRLTRILERLYDAERQVKSAGIGADAIIRMLMNDVAKVAETA